MSIIKKYFPNILTILRIVLIYPIIVIYLNFSNNNTLFHILLICLFIIAIATDYFDGWISRKYNTQSNFGRICDPIADKLLTSTLFIVFTYDNKTLFICALIIILRDIWITFLRFIIIKRTILSANTLGKSKTIIHFVTLLFYIIINNNSFQLIKYILLLINVVISIISGLHYHIQALYIIRHNYKKNRS